MVEVRKREQQGIELFAPVRKFFQRLHEKGVMIRAGDYRKGSSAEAQVLPAPEPNSSSYTWRAPEYNDGFRAHKAEIFVHNDGGQGFVLSSWDEGNYAGITRSKNEHSTSHKSVDDLLDEILKILARDCERL